MSVPMVRAKKTAVARDLVFAAKCVVPITLIAGSLAWLSGQIAMALGFDVAPQNLVALFADPNVPRIVKFRAAALAVLAFPAIEELVFRCGLFRWTFRRLFKFRFPFAAGTSAVLFAAAHYFAGGGLGTLLVTFVPLAFLGVAFAWVYERTDDLAAPIFVHACFNALNLAVCLLFPEAAHSP